MRVALSGMPAPTNPVQCEHTLLALMLRCLASGARRGGPAAGLCLRAHEDEAEGVHRADQRVEHPRVPGAVRLVQQRVDRVAADQRVQRPAQVAHRLAVVLLRHGVAAGAAPRRTSVTGARRAEATGTPLARGARTCSRRAGTYHALCRPQSSACRARRMTHNPMYLT